MPAALESTAVGEGLDKKPYAIPSRRLDDAKAAHLPPAKTRLSGA